MDKIKLINKISNKDKDAIKDLMNLYKINK